MFKTVFWEDDSGPIRAIFRLFHIASLVNGKISSSMDLRCVRARSVLVGDSPDVYTLKTLFYVELAVYGAFEQRKTG